MKRRPNLRTSHPSTGDRARERALYGTKFGGFTERRPQTRSSAGPRAAPASPNPGLDENMRMVKPHGRLVLVS
jgi:hypothetical protein